MVYDAFAKCDDTSRSTISHRIFGRVTKLQDVIDGADLNTLTYDRARKWFSDNWPENAVWPENVERPTVGMSLSEASHPRKGADGRARTKAGAA